MSCWDPDPLKNKKGRVDTAYRLPFGKYKGRTLDNVPINYLVWLLDRYPVDNGFAGGGIGGRVREYLGGVWHGKVPKR